MKFWLATLSIFKKDFIYLFLENREGKKKERERNINEWLPLMGLLLGTWPSTQACALIGNRTYYPLVHRLPLNPPSHTSQGTLSIFSHYYWPFGYLLLWCNSGFIHSNNWKNFLILSLVLSPHFWVFLILIYVVLSYNWSFTKFPLVYLKTIRLWFSSALWTFSWSVFIIYQNVFLCLIFL